MAIAKRIHVLGTGVAIVRKYYNTAFILEDESSYFLVDGMGGIDILRRFDEMKLDWQKLHHAFCHIHIQITHWEWFMFSDMWHF